MLSTLADLFGRPVGADCYRLSLLMQVYSAHNCRWQSAGEPEHGYPRLLPAPVLGGIVIIVWCFTAAGPLPAKCSCSDVSGMMVTDLGSSARRYQTWSQRIHELNYYEWRALTDVLHRIRCCSQHLLYVLSAPLPSPGTKERYKRRSFMGPVLHEYALGASRGIECSYLSILSRVLDRFVIWMNEDRHTAVPPTVSPTTPLLLY